MPDPSQLSDLSQITATILIFDTQALLRGNIRAAQTKICRKVPFTSRDAHSAGRKRSEPPQVPKRFPRFVDFPRDLRLGKEVV
jgi:hypothetical protein